MPPYRTPESLRHELQSLFREFEGILNVSDVREKVLALVPAVNLLRELGVSLIPGENRGSARDRILKYLRAYSGMVVSGDELSIVSGISEYARRVRELRVQSGWAIYSGRTARQMLDEDDWTITEHDGVDKAAIEAMRPEDYILVGSQDRDAAHRWALANDIRRLNLSMRDRILRYLLENVGHPITGEELRYVANGQSWPRRARELRTEQGWPLVTRSSGRPDLPLGVYLLEADRQSLPHDRQISDPARVGVLERDGFACRCCGWKPRDHALGDPRSLLELHHIEHHVSGGGNEIENLITLCNVHHDDLHRRKIENQSGLDAWLGAGCA